MNMNIFKYKALQSVLVRKREMKDENINKRAEYKIN